MKRMAGLRHIREVSLADQHDEWVTRVLGVRIAAASGADTAKRLLTLWQDAKDEVDAKINELAAAVREEGDPDLDQIADKGLIGVTGGTAVKLTKAFLELRSAGPDKRETAATALREAAQAYRNTVFAHPLVDLIDDNPWGIKVGLRAKLDVALTTVIREAA